MESNKEKHIFNNYYFLCNNRSERILEWNIIDNNIFKQSVEGFVNTPLRITHNVL